jgi:endonuclease/exonuclease/phosphatase (EEP) superfamily protein YafD
VIDAIREDVDAWLAAGERVLVIGDYNVTPTEAGYARLVEGLRDAHAEAGNGSGWTWRPHRLATLRVGVIRIDYVLSSPELEPIGTELRCDVPGDHCILIADLAMDSIR